MERMKFNDIRRDRESVTPSSRRQPLAFGFTRFQHSTLRLMILLSRRYKYKDWRHNEHKVSSQSNG